MQCAPHFLIAFAALVHAAPAPVYREPPPRVLVGNSWTMNWRTHVSTVRLYPCGHFEDDFEGERWVGCWTLTDDELTVEEARPGHLAMVWTVTLTPTRKGAKCVEGRLRGGGRFRLTRQPPAD